MKRISIVDATEEQIIEYIKNNPDSWTLGELIDYDEQVYRAMEDPSWIDLFKEAVYLYPDCFDVDYDEDGCVDMESKKNKREFKNYIDGAMDSLDKFITEDDIDIEIYWHGDILEVVYINNKNGEKLDNEIIHNGKNLKIEVE